jgi:hypothetical protein
MAILYTCYLIEEKGAELLEQFDNVHNNIHRHHSTIEFGPKSTELAEDLTTIEITGRLTTNLVDCLIVSKENNLSKNENPHITLSTANNIKPFASNNEIKNNYDKIVWFDSPIELPVRIVTFFNF